MTSESIDKQIKAVEVFNIVLNTAIHTSKQMGNLSSYSGGRNTRYSKYVKSKNALVLVSTAINAAMAAMQICSIQSQPIPKFKRCSLR